MKRLLIIDDERLYQKMVEHAVQPFGFEIQTADDGAAGVAAALKYLPDLIICDVKMPRLSGYQVVAQLRKDPRFAHIPILILTGQSELSDKLEAFEAGADDFVMKPFEPAELIARINALLRRMESYQNLQGQLGSSGANKSRVLAVHSLRGGVGCSSLAANIGIALALKHASTVIIDLVFIAGQIALILNGALKRTWSNIAQFDIKEIDWDVLQSIIGHHDSSVQWIAAPTYPTEADLISYDLFTAAFEILRVHFEYVVADLPHDFSQMTISVLDAADQIIVPLAPELASLRATAAALDTYQKLGYPNKKVKLVMNWTFSHRGYSSKQIETALKHPIELALPYAPELFIEAINTGQPLVFSKPKDRISEELFAFVQRLRNPS